ncbi:MAG: O-antigen ligase family protein [Patescibacteria group bacterium]|nr:O-antigen ligase family protein [Patescibacteria group bacterium]
MLKLFLKLDSLIWFLAIVILIAIPLMQKFPFLEVPGTFVSIRVEDLLLFLTFVIVVFRVSQKFFEYIDNRIIKFFVVFSGIGLVSYLCALMITQTIIPHIGFLHWARRIEYFVPFILGYEFFRTKDIQSRLNVVINCILVVIVFAFVYGFGQRYFSLPIIITQNEEYSKGIALKWVEGSHINSTFAGHYDLSTYLVLILSIIIALFFLFQKSYSKAILGVAWILGMWLLVNAASRISFLSYLVSSVFVLILLKKFKAIVFLLTFSILFASMSSNLLARYQRIIEVTLTEYLSVNSLLTVHASIKETDVLPETARQKTLTITPTPIPVFEDRSTNIRLDVEWPRAIRAFNKNPLLGTGYSSLGLATDNTYLRALGEVGILGFFSFLGLLGSIWFVFLKVVRFKKLIPEINLTQNLTIAKGFLAGVIGAQVGILINGVFIDVFEASKFAITFWLFSGFAVGLISFGIKKDKNVSV